MADIPDGEPLVYGRDYTLGERYPSKSMTLRRHEIALMQARLYELGGITWRLPDDPMDTPKWTITVGVDEAWRN